MTAQINLYNPALRARREYITATTIALGLLLVVVGIVLVYGYYQWRVAQLTQESVAVETDLKMRQDQMAVLADEVARVRHSKAVEQQLADAEAMLRGREAVATVLSTGVLGSAQGFSDYLRAFARQILPGVWITGLDIAAGGTAIRIEGRTTGADQVPAYIKRLTGEKSLQGRSFTTLEIHQPEAQDSASPETAAPPGRSPVSAALPPLEFVLSSTLTPSASSTTPASEATR